MYIGIIALIVAIALLIWGMVSLGTDSKKKKGDDDDDDSFWDTIISGIDCWF